jgi:methylmalonyl-CoA mutase N-terminal domain/subunit
MAPFDTLGTGSGQAVQQAEDTLTMIERPSRTWARKGPGAGALDRTISDVPLKTVYGPDDLAQLDLARDLPPPGEYPYTRGIHRNGYRDRLWTMRQFAGFGTAGQTNERYHFLLEHGQHGLSVAFDRRAAKSANAALRSTRSPTWSCSSTASTWARLRPR